MTLDNEQKQIIGNLLIWVVIGVGAYFTGKLQLWFTDPALLTLLGTLIAAFIYSARKWIKYTFGIEENDLDAGEDHGEEIVVPP